MKKYTESFPPNYDLDKYIQRIMAEKKLTLAEISRESVRNGEFVSQPSLSDIINKKRGAGRKAARAISAGLGVPLNDVLLHAGIMDLDPERDEAEAEINYLYHKLKHHWAKNQALNFMRWLVSMEETGNGQSEGNVIPTEPT
jgi:hypothetical protein